MTSAHTPLFPLTEPPRCSRCNLPSRLQPPKYNFYFCTPCNQFITWDDDRDVRPENPLCFCDSTSRQCFSKKTNKHFYACAKGGCKFIEPRTPPMSPFKVALNGTEPPASSPTDPTALHRLPATPQSRVDQKYMDLIDHVLNCAEAADFPRKSLELNSMMAALSAIGPSAQDNNLPPPYPKIQYKNEFERHSKIGALGELYVYTLLQHKLPGRVDLKHWQSNMRDHIRAHNQFREMPPWTGSETADIVLPDDDGGLTDLLIENGYLDGATWAGKKPLYYIEVKATMNDRRQFYMSGDQYLRMQGYYDHDPSGANQPKVYVIARVSNIQEDNIRLRLLVDPEQMKNDGKLRFKQTWVVEEMYG